MSIEQKMQLTPFSDGVLANIFTLTNRHGSSISIMDIGATWLSCQIQMKGELREVLLGVDSMQKHLEQDVYLGGTIGRVANRIKNGRFDIDGQSVQVSTNEANNSLHGGVDGFDKRRWDVAEKLSDKITFSLTSADGDQGFPGLLLASVSYQFNDDNEVCIEYHASVDKTCPVNLTNHAYFNLLGAEQGQDCLSHFLQINAEQYLPSDKAGIPFNDLQPVSGSSFDFRQEKVIEQDFLSDQQQLDKSGYDHSFFLNNTHQDSNKPALTLTAPDRSLQLQVSTNKPALHLYTGNFLAGTPGRSSTIYKTNSGIALETQFLPDSPNHLAWSQGSSVFLLPEQKYQFMTLYAFNVL